MALTDHRETMLKIMTEALDAAIAAETKPRNAKKGTKVKPKADEETENVSPSSFTPAFLSDCFASIEAKDKRVEWVEINPALWAGLRDLWADILEIKAKPKNNNVANVWGALIKLNPNVPVDQIKLFTGKTGTQFRVSSGDPI